MDNKQALTVYVGHDKREQIAFDVCVNSIRSRSNIQIQELKIDDLTNKGLMWRPVEKIDGQMWDVISNKPQATEFAICRFLVPVIHQTGWAIFMDCDMILTQDINNIIPYLDDTKAVMVVKHNQVVTEEIKMDGQIQTVYPRKNWSSFMAFNCDHPANKTLSLNTINEQRGLWLHSFSWLSDDLIGELPNTWNWLVGVQDKPEQPIVVHFTLGGPWFNDWDAKPHDEMWTNEYHLQTGV